MHRKWKDPKKKKHFEDKKRKEKEKTEFTN
jgi:hypothetical protein